MQLPPEHSEVLFWPPPAPGTQVVPRQIDMQTTQTPKTNKSKVIACSHAVLSRNLTQISPLSESHGGAVVIFLHFHFICLFIF